MGNTDYQPVAVKVGTAAKMLGLSDTKTVYGLIHTGQLKARKVRRLYLVNVNSIKALVGE